MDEPHQPGRLSYKRQADLDADRFSDELMLLLSEQADVLEVDLLNIEYMDSLEMSYIARFIHMARDRNRSYRVLVSPSVAETFELVGFTVTRTSGRGCEVDFGS